MTTKSAIALAALLVAAGTTAGCDYGTPAGGPEIGRAHV